MLGTLALLAALHPGLASAEGCDDLAGRVVSVEGEVTVAGQAADMGDEICGGEAISVGSRSRAAVRLEATQTVVRIDQNSTFLIEPSDEDRSWLKLLEGVIYLFSRRPETLRVDTPYVNAAIDGTEFVVATSAGVGEVTVIEGSVLVGNALGEVRLAAGEAASAGPDRSPRRAAVVDPFDAVRWALHYPPIGASEDTGEATRTAATLLATGDVEPALELLANAPEDAVSLALRSMVAVTRNRPLEALRLAERAVNVDAGSSVAYTALSYAHQARFDIDQALGSAIVAVQNDPRNAHALARQAELHLGVDDTAAALASARQAIRVEPENSRARTVLGFVRLVRLEVDEAETAFADAIERDPGDPLPRLGLGLAVIRDGRLVEGREHIEVAASLDPADALVRSYLGKAYFEERQSADAGAQFELAQRLDPQDPTPWLYGALLAQALNRPARAYRNVQRARALNDNRQVYQSRLLVDKSDATGTLSLARIYTDLGFEQPAINESTRSIALDPTNFSAHRFLADSYSGRERHEAARRSVLFQAALLQPLTINPVQPYTQESDLLILPGTDPVDPSIREYSPLFEREGFQLAGSLVGGDDGTFGDNLVFSGLHDRVAYGLGQFHYETDGFRPNADIEHDVYHGFVQGQVWPTVFVQADLQRQVSEQGDLSLNLDLEDPIVRSRREMTSPRLGLRAEIGPRSTLLLATRAIDREEVTSRTFPGATAIESFGVDGQEAFVRFIHRRANTSHSLGVDAHELDQRLAVVLEPCPEEPCGSDVGTVGSRFANYYYYADIDSGRRLRWTLGLSYTTFDDELASLDVRDINPKLGLRWSPAPSHELRFSAGRGAKRSDVADLMLEPTVLAGFNQVRDDFAGTRYANVGIAYDRHAGPGVLYGIELLHRDLDVPVTVRSLVAPENSRAFVESQRETTLRGYWSRLVRSDVSVGLNLLHERFERDDSRGPTGAPELPQLPLGVDTTSLPVSVRYTRPSGFFAQGEVSAVHQSVERVEREGDSAFVVDAESEFFTNLDLSFGMRLPSRRATFRVDLRNVFDERFLFQGSSIRSTEPDGQRFSRERSVVGRVSFSFR